MIGHPPSFARDDQITLEARGFPRVFPSFLADDGTRCEDVIIFQFNSKAISKCCKNMLYSVVCQVIQ